MKVFSDGMALQAGWGRRVGGSRFSFKEDTLLLIAEVMGEDIVPEKIRDEVHTEVKCVGPAALTTLVIGSSKEFEDKWFRKIKDHFCPFENQFHTEIQILL